MRRLYRVRLAVVLLGVLLALTAAGVTGATLVERRDGFCASCHTEPESTYQARSMSALANGRSVDLASFHQKQLPSGQAPLLCIDCHSGEGVLGRGVVLSLAAFDALKHFTGTARQPAALVFTIQNEGCLKCHTEQAQQPGFDNHFHNKLFEPGAPYERCVDCHPSHRTGIESTRYAFRDVILPICQDCHRAENKGPVNMGLGN